MIAGPWYKVYPATGTFSNTTGTVVIDVSGDYDGTSCFDYDSTAAPARLTREQLRGLKQRLASMHPDRCPSVTIDTISHKYQNTSTLSDVQPATSGDTRPLGVRRASSISGVRYCAYLHERKDPRSQLFACLGFRGHKTHTLTRFGKNSGVQFRPKRFLYLKRTKARQQL
jgi:hypothetical protein